MANLTPGLCGVMRNHWFSGRYEMTVDLAIWNELSRDDARQLFADSWAPHGDKFWALYRARVRSRGSPGLVLAMEIWEATCQ